MIKIPNINRAQKTPNNGKIQPRVEQKRILELQQALKKVETDNFELRKSGLSRIERMNNQIQQIFKMYSNKKAYSRQNTRTQAQISLIKETYENIKANNAMMAEELQKKENDRQNLISANKQIKQLNQTIRQMKIDHETEKKKMLQQFKKQKQRISKKSRQSLSKQKMNNKSSNMMQRVETHNNNNEIRQFYENYVKKLKQNHEMEIQELKRKVYKNLDIQSEKDGSRERVISFEGKLQNLEFQNISNDKIRMIIQENVNQALYQKDCQYSEIIRQLELKNNQLLTHIMALEGATMVLREQLALNLNKEVDKRHQNLKKRRESSMSQSSKRSQPYLRQFKSPRNSQANSFAIPRQTTPRGNWKNQIGVYRSSNFIENSNNGRQQVQNFGGLLDKIYRDKKNKSFLPTWNQDVISEVFEPKQSLNLQHQK